MFNEKFKEVLAHEGPVSLTTWANNDAHVTNTWNSYLKLTEDDRILLPMAGMHSTQADLAINNQIKITLASREVQGTIGAGAGFYIEGTTEFLDSGDEFDQMVSEFPFLRQVMVVYPSLVKQTI
ncbi:pyridoxamine 5'-phosphate oxidase family protein [Enterococcus wangshanyuanii]|uniref:FMN-binding protein n=1 Tax=Enterococcus wangshanyuanii TaxID=2005703 RepID=A0ABQ1P421_9ENTE|nr:pyridoxamine 5'-phosphate oxidase family protein [Enterococcus wangshanyuanii]GGC90725.1 FMN-binding protein [Enterococcus wangshanyuanii]